MISDLFYFVIDKMKLNRWIREIYGNDGSKGNPLTHTKMSGGKYFIPEDKYDEFQKMYSHDFDIGIRTCLLYTSPSPRDQRGSRMPSSA